jgi:glycosyltransferase involved in cell wall biosynthesis
MIVGIDASNVRVGGGLTHLVEILRVAEPETIGFSKVILWAGHESLRIVDDRSWMDKSHQPMLDKTLLHRILWQRFTLGRLARLSNCDVLFVPGGSYAGDFEPIVTMSQNMLPFDKRELRRYACSYTSLRLNALRWTQSHTFRKAAGLIFLTRYAREIVMREIEAGTAETTIIPHGVGTRFICSPRKQLPISYYSTQRPFRILYVSIIDMYKHQWTVVEAVSRLRKHGIPVTLDLVGPSYPRALLRLQRTLARIDPSGKFAMYSGSVPHVELPARYAQADLCLFASSCENMPNILLEGMASGLPIACSDRGPMPEVLGTSGVYFDPENPEDIAHALQSMIDSPDLRMQLAEDSFRRAQAFSWQQCANETFGFLARIATAQPGKSVATGQV